MINDPIYWAIWIVLVGSVITIGLLEVRRRRPPLEKRHRYCSFCGGRMRWFQYARTPAIISIYWMCNVPSSVSEAHDEGHNLVLVHYGKVPALYDKRTGGRIG